MNIAFGDTILRPYQARDVRKFMDLPSCLVSYDKQVGKTITALALCLLRRQQGETGPILIISDKESPWVEGLNMVQVPSDSIHLVDRPRRLELKRQLAQPQCGHFYQIHWAGLVPELAALYGIQWSHIIADELHAAKNRKSQRTKALKKLRTRYKIGLTADPDDNSPQDIWSLLNWLYPRQYSSYWRWVREYVEVERKTGRSGDYLTFGAPINVEKFRAEIEPFFVRLSMKDIDPLQVPDIYEQHLVTMTPEQSKAYDDMVELQMMQMGDENVLVISEWVMVVAMRLQQLAQSMGKPETRSVWRTTEETDPTTGQRVKVRKKVETVKIHQVEPSPKLDDLIATIISNDDPIGPTIVFSQFPEMIGLACARLRALGIPHASVQHHSDITPSQTKFQRGEVDLILGSTAMMSESIKLNRADTIIFLDCPWNPRVRGQAIGRAKAVGKRTTVRIIDIRTKDTVDFARLDRVRTKQEWKNVFLGRE